MLKIPGLKYKGLTISEGLIYFFYCFSRILYYRVMIENRGIGPAEMMVRAREKGSKKKKDCEQNKALSHLGKAAKISNFILLRILRTDRPCLIRSLIIYELAQNYSLNVEIFIGSRKGIKIEAHSWVSVDDELIFDKGDYVNSFTVVLKGEDCEKVL